MHLRLLRSVRCLCVSSSLAHLHSWPRVSRFSRIADFRRQLATASYRRIDAHKHAQNSRTGAKGMLVATGGVTTATASSSQASWQVGKKPTNRVGHLVPAEVEVGGVGMDHRCGAVKRTNFFIVTDVWKRKESNRTFLSAFRTKRASIGNAEGACSVGQTQND